MSKKSHFFKPKKINFCRLSEAEIVGNELIVNRTGLNPWNGKSF